MCERADKRYSSWLLIGVLGATAGNAYSPEALGACARETVDDIAYRQLIDPDYEEEEGGFGLGRFVAYPCGDLEMGHDFNLYKAAANEKSDWFTVVSPGVAVRSRRGPWSYDLSYDVDVGRYLTSSQDNYEDHRLETAAQFSSGSIAGGLKGRYEDAHDARGSGRTEGFPPVTDPDEWHKWSGQAFVAYGNRAIFERPENGPAHLRAYVDRYSLTYDNNRSATAVLDHRWMPVGAEFDYRILPPIALSAEASYTPFDYDDRRGAGTINQDSDEWMMRFGGRWSFTEITEGKATIGALHKGFDDPSRSDYTGLSWSLAAYWQPLDRSRVNFGAYRSPSESTGTGTVILTDAVFLNWTHYWREWLDTDLSINVSGSDYRGSPREDDNHSLGLKVGYDAPPTIVKLRLEGGYEYSQRDSNRLGLDYDRHFFNVTARVGM